MCRKKNLIEYSAQIKDISIVYVFAENKDDAAERIKRGEYETYYMESITEKIHKSEDVNVGKLHLLLKDKNN